MWFGFWPTSTGTNTGNREDLASYAKLKNSHNNMKQPKLSIALSIFFSLNCRSTFSLYKVSSWQRWILIELYSIYSHATPSKDNTSSRTLIFISWAREVQINSKLNGISKPVRYQFKSPKTIRNYRTSSLILHSKTIWIRITSHRLHKSPPWLESNQTTQTKLLCHHHQSP